MSTLVKCGKGPLPPLKKSGKMKAGENMRKSKSHVVQCELGRLEEVEVLAVRISCSCFGSSGRGIRGQVHRNTLSKLIWISRTW